jgi:hypothetical protein
MRDIQARRRRKIVGPTPGDRAPAVGHDPAHGSPGPEPVDVGGWENEGGAGRSNRDGGTPEESHPTSRLVGRE